MANGLFYYKLISNYPEDVTKNCKLTVNEIDQNFKNLKDYDIEKAELDKDNLSVILTRKDGDTLVVDLKPILSGSVYDLEVIYENPSGDCRGANVYVSYNMLTEDGDMAAIKVPIKGLVTTDNIKEVIDDNFNFNVVSDETLTGNGTMSSPLGISKTELDRPVINEIDMTVGETLPENPKRGDRYVTKEYVSDYGYLYNYERGVASIKEMLERDGRGWRIPTKEDWDCLLNSLEPCEYRNHNSSACHEWLGKYAGKRMKSTCGWSCCPQEDCACQNTVPYPGQVCEKENINDDVIEDDETYVDDEVLNNDIEPQEIEIPDYCGIDEFGYKIMPSGIVSDRGSYQYFGQMAGFWTDTHLKLCAPGGVSVDDQDIYVKEFDCQMTGVYQKAICPQAYYSIRLVKDYNGENIYDTETIDGINYKTVLSPECGLIWTASNFASNKYGAKPVNDGFVPDNRIVYFINVWNGKEWEKRALTEGESFVQMDGNEHCQYNIEYRIYTADGCNQEKVNVDDTVVMRVLDKVIPLIEEERDERIAADEALSGAIDSLAEALSAETAEREAADAILQEEIEAESSRAQEVEQQLWEAINNESEARETTDNQLWEAIEQEASARTDVDNQLWEAINNETERAQDVEAQLWSGLTEEATIREEIDNQQWAAIENEARIREEIDNQQWDAINNEIERAKAREDEIDGQLIDWSKNPFTLSATEGLTLPSKDGNEDHFINIKLSADFGTF